MINNILVKLFKNNKKSFFGTGFFFIAVYWIYKTYIKKSNNNNNNNNNNIDNNTNNGNKSEATNENDSEPAKKVKFTNFFKLSDDLKIHVLSTPEQCDLILNDYYQSLLSKMDNVSNTIVDGADILSTTSSSTSTALLFPSCNEKNNFGLDFMIGFDAEWGYQQTDIEEIKNTHEDGTPKYNHKVALIQLSSKDTVFIIQVSQFPSIPASLEKILTDPRLIKVGVAVSQDAATIFDSFSTVTKGCVDLVPIARLVGYEGNGLASLALNVINATLDKNNFVRCSHWEHRVLTPEQVHYAAADAWVGREIFVTMYNKYKQSKIVQQEKDLVYALCRPFINTNFKVKVKTKSNDKSSKNNNNSNKPVKENQLQKTVPDQRVLYDNCLMYSPEDVLLCSISKKKVEWYVSRQLADIINENPLTIKLKFKPNGEGHSGDDYYLAHKENICVVCGSTHKILRHSVVPHCYRQYLPEEIKSHSSHDVLLLCCDCHANMDKRTQIMRMMIAKQYNVPLESENKFLIDSALLKVSKMALIIKNQFYQNEEEQDGTTEKKEPAPKTKIPDYKLQEMKNDIAIYIGKEVSQLSLEDLNKLIYLNPKQKNENYVPHEKMVVDKVLALGEKGIFEFVRSWRINFIETVQPSFLNEHWSVDKDIINSYKPKSQKQKQIEL